MNSQVNLLRMVIAGAETLVETQGWTPKQVAEALTLWFKRQEPFTKRREDMKEDHKMSKECKEYYKQIAV